MNTNSEPMNTGTRILAILLLLSMTGGFFSCQTGKDRKSTEITLYNPSSVVLKDKAIIIQRGALPGIPEGDLYPVVLNASGDSIPAQVDDLDGDGNWDELFFLMTLDSNREERVSLSWVTDNPGFEKRTSVRFGVRSSPEARIQPALCDTFYPGELPWIIGYQPYQTDGPSWENDKVGFRHYFDGRNAKDVFGKTADYMSPETVGISQDGIAEDNYHVMADWGRDILAVGNSVGMGGIALKVGDRLARIGVLTGEPVGNVENTVFRILSEGPVRSVMSIRYNGWRTLDREYQVEELISIWPGMYGYKNSVRFSGLKGDETALIGLVNVNTDKLPVEIKASEKWTVLYTHDQQTYNREWWLGLALILPAKAYSGYISAPEAGEIQDTYLAELKVSEGDPLDYFAVACWELSDPGFRDAAYFKKYLTDLTTLLGTEVKVTVKQH